MKVICLDTETTGLNKEKARVIDVCIVELDSMETHYCRVNPTVPIEEDAFKAHGITEEMVKDQPFFMNYASGIQEEIEKADVIIGYNPDFDIEILKAEFNRLQRKVKWPQTVICLKKLWDKHEPPPPRHLQAAFARFVDPKGFEGAHDAVNDVKATIRVWECLANEFQLTTVPWDQLLPKPANWVAGSHHLIWKDENKTTILVNFGKHEGQTLANVDDWYLGYIQKQDFPDNVKQIAKFAQGMLKQKIPLEDKDLIIATWAKENL